MEERKKLLYEYLKKEGFIEAEKRFLTVSHNYYKTDTELTAFFANVKEREDSLGVCFGLASTAFTRIKGCENSLEEYGILNEENCLRQFLFIREKEDISAFAAQISAMRMQYRGMPKDDLLHMLKQKRKAFLNQIHEELKPFGFKKKGNEWRLLFPEGYTLFFHGDKSSYCDCYRFDVMIHTQAEPVRRCTYEQLFLVKNPIEPESPSYFDWQMNSREELMKILDTLLSVYVRPALDAGMKHMGRQEQVRRCRRCQENRCPDCWLE